jgi:ribosomal protein L24E
MSFVGWINNDKQNIIPECLAMNPNPKLISYLKRNPAMIDWKVLSANPNAIDLFVYDYGISDYHPSGLIDWQQICLNPHPDAIRLIKERHQMNMEKYNNGKRIDPYFILHWQNLSKNTNPDAIAFLKENPVNLCFYRQEQDYDPYEDDKDYNPDEKKDLYGDQPYQPDDMYQEESPQEYAWHELCENPAATDFVKENNQIILAHLTKNTSDAALEIIKEDIKYIHDPYSLCWLSENANPKAVELLEENPEKIVWASLCKNPNAKALALLEKNPDKIDWTYLSANPSTIELLEKNPDKIDLRWLCKNPKAGKLLGKMMYDDTTRHFADKLDWRWLSANPCIFK